MTPTTRQGARGLRRFSLVAVLAVLGAALALLALGRRAEHPYLASLGDGVTVMAHQGGDGLWPSNTLYAFRRAAELGADVLELDVHASKDGYIVVIHDDTVDRTTNGSGPVKDKTLYELQILDAGYDWSPERIGESFPYRGQGLQIPTLDEVFRAFPDRPINIEIKQLEPSIAGPLCDLIRFHGKERRVLVVSFYDRAMRDFRARCPEVATAATPGEVRRFYILHRLFLARLARPPAEAMQVPETQGALRLVTERFVRDAHAKNVQIHVWTVDDRAAMERLTQLGVDGIMSDRPDRLLKVLGRPGDVALPEGVPE